MFLNLIFYLICFVFSNASLQVLDFGARAYNIRAGGQSRNSSSLIHKNFFDLLKNCLMYIPEHRISLVTANEHPFFESLPEEKKQPSPLQNSGPNLDLQYLLEGRTADSEAALHYLSACSPTQQLLAVLET